MDSGFSNGPAVDEAEHRPSTVRIILDTRENLEAAAQASRAVHPTPPYQFHGRSVFPAGAGGEMAVAEGARHAVDLEGARAHQRPGIALAERFQGRELRQQTGGDVPRREVQLVLDAAGQQLLGP